MVSFTLVQNRIYTRGYKKCAEKLGVNFKIYRSTNGLNPIQPNNLLPDQKVWIDQDFKANKSRKYGDMTWQFTPEFGLTLQNYDYMVGPTTTYFIGDIAPSDRFTPPLCVECNGIISLFDLTNAPLIPGKNNYQEYGNKVPILLNCPVAILQNSKMDMENMKLPTSVKLPYYSIFVPYFDDIVIKSGNEIEDNKGRKMMVINAEQTKKSLGIRIIAQSKSV